MTPDRNFIVIGLGELLWDMFPEGKQLGGAPANFAYMTRLLGDEGIVASRVGSDALGRAAGRRLERLGVLHRRFSNRSAGRNRLDDVNPRDGRGVGCAV